MKWSKEAEEAVAKVPFFVRRRVRQRVEEEARQCGAQEVNLEHVRTCQRRFLNKMEEEVKGYQVETCFGPTGCPNQAVKNSDLSAKIENLLSAKNMRSFLKEKVNGPLKLHHEFRVSISDCPNACSRPQIADIGLIGACVPEMDEESCSLCQACVEICREGALFLREGKIVLDSSRCLYCGQCIKVCPPRALKEQKNGYRIQVGGKLGRHPLLAKEMPGIYDTEETLRIITNIIDFYQIHCQKGERLGEVLELTGLPQFYLWRTG
jgi:dissimilatory sulfite reductase (desulfoviridin) alpha/beta subunit